MTYSTNPIGLICQDSEARLGSHISKRQKLHHPRGSQPPAKFWDNLSKIWLTERALKELDGRNTQPALNSHCSLSQRSRPVTRLAVTHWTNKEENWEPTQPAAESPTHYSAESLEDVKLLARQGGPELSDLRGVGITTSLLELTLIMPSLVPEAYPYILLHNELKPV